MVQKSKLKQEAVLKAKGIDVHAKDRYARTPLHLATEYNKKKSNRNSIEGKKNRHSC